MSGARAPRIRRPWAAEPPARRGVTAATVADAMVVTAGATAAGRVIGDATAATVGRASATATPSGAVSGRPPGVVQEHRLTTLDSGVRIVTEAMPAVRSVSLGFWIGTGSRSESDDQAG